MKIRSFISVSLAGFMLIQSCSKNQYAKPAGTSTAGIITPAGTKLKIEGAGDHGTYQLISANGGNSVQIANLSLADGGVENMAPYTGIAHQQWRITDQGNGYYKLMNDGSGKYIQSYLYQGTQELIQASSNTSDAQLWDISSVGNGYYRAINKATGLAATNEGDNTRVKLKPYGNNNTQWWSYNQFQDQAYRDDEVVNFFHRVLPSQGSIAFDQGSSIPLSDGRVLWVTEDAFDGTRVTADGNLKCGFFQYHNSILIQPANHDWDPNNTPNMTIANSTANQPRQICDTQPGLDWSWPGVGMEVGNTVYLYCGEGKGLGLTGQSIYELTENGPDNNQWAVKRTLPAGISTQTDIGYASGMVKPGDGYVYVYGTHGVFFNASNVYVARFSETDPHTYTFWNGTAWVATPTTAKAAAVASGQQNIAMGYLHGKYIMMQLDLGYFCDPSSHNIYLSTSSSPLGPFTNPLKVFSIEDRYRGHLNRYYTPMIHTEFDNGKNELLLTYSVNFGSDCAGVSSDNCINNEQPSINYQVKGVRVPYALIGL